MAKCIVCGAILPFGGKKLDGNNYCGKKCIAKSQAPAEGEKKPAKFSVIRVLGMILIGIGAVGLVGGFMQETINPLAVFIMLCGLALMGVKSSS